MRRMLGWVGGSASPQGGAAAKKRALGEGGAAPGGYQNQITAEEKEMISVGSRLLLSLEGRSRSQDAILFITFTGSADNEFLAAGDAEGKSYFQKVKGNPKH